MAGKRRQETEGALREGFGIILLFASFAALSFALYALGGIWAGVVPAALAGMWIGYNLASRSPAPHETPAGTRSGTRTELPKYRDPDAELPVGFYERDTERDLPPVQRESERD